MKKIITLLFVLSSVLSIAQVPTFEIVSPKPVNWWENKVEFQNGWPIQFTFYAKYWNKNDKFFVSQSVNTIDTIWYKDFVNDTLRRSYLFKWGDNKSRFVCWHETCYEMIPIALTAIGDENIEESNDYKYFDVYGREMVVPRGLVIRSDGERIMFSE